MFGSWLDKKFSKTQRKEAESFISLLEQSSMADLEAIHASTLFWFQFYQNQGLEIDRIDEWIKDRPFFPKEVGDLAKDFQKEGLNAQVNGLLVLVFSARAALYPELVDTGTRIWKTLSRAPKSSFQLANEFIEAANKSTIDPSEKLELFEL